MLTALTHTHRYCTYVTAVFLSCVLQLWCFLTTTGLWSDAAVTALPGRPRGLHQRREWTHKWRDIPWMYYKNCMRSGQIHPVDICGTTTISPSTKGNFTKKSLISPPFTGCDVIQSQKQCKATTWDKRWLIGSSLKRLTRLFRGTIE